MSAAVAAPAPPGGLAARVWATLVAAWGIAAGLAPHVLHHVGPLAGAALSEMYGYPLTVYLLTGPLAGLVPASTSRITPDTSGPI